MSSKVKGLVFKLSVVQWLLAELEYRNLSNLKVIFMCMHKVINKYLYRQGEYLNEIGAVYENIYGIDQWWIGLTDL